jgi:hypothetical protein
MRTGVSSRAVSGRALAFVVAPDAAVALMGISQTIALLSIAVLLFSRVDL